MFDHKLAQTIIGTRVEHIPVKWIYSGTSTPKKNNNNETSTKLDDPNHINMSFVLGLHTLSNLENREFCQLQTQQQRRKNKVFFMYLLSVTD